MNNSSNPPNILDTLSFHALPSAALPGGAVVESEEIEASGPEKSDYGSFGHGHLHGADASAFVTWYANPLHHHHHGEAPNNPVNPGPVPANPTVHPQHHPQQPHTGEQFGTGDGFVGGVPDGRNDVDVLQALQIQANASYQFGEFSGEALDGRNFDELRAQQERLQLMSASLQQQQQRHAYYGHPSPILPPMHLQNDQSYQNHQGAPPLMQAHAGLDDDGSGAYVPPSSDYAAPAPTGGFVRYESGPARGNGGYYYDPHTDRQHANPFGGDFYGSLSVPLPESFRMAPPAMMGREASHSNYADRDDYDDGWNDAEEGVPLPPFQGCGDEGVEPYPHQPYTDVGGYYNQADNTMDQFK